MTKKVTMKDIANALNITVDAVSKSLRDSPRISNETKAKVLEKAKELGYVKNNFAVSLKTGKSNLIAVYINSLLNPYFSIAATIILEELKRQGYIGILCFSDRHFLSSEHLNQVFVNNCAAVITLVEPNEEAINVLKNNQIPIYLFGIPLQNQYVNYIASNDYEGGCLVAKDFMNRKAKNGLYVTDSFSVTSKYRFDGFYNTLYEHNINSIYEIHSCPETNLSSDIIKIIEKEKIDYIFCYSDYLAQKVKKWIDNYDSNLLKKIHFVGYDHLSFWTELVEDIPSIGYNMEKMSKIVINSLNEVIFTQKKIKRMEILVPVKLYQKIER